MEKHRICLVAPPLSGHLNPLLGIGIHLAKVAEVTVISTPMAMTAVSRAGLKGCPILAEREDLICAIVSPGHPVKSHPLRLFRQLRANVSMQSEMKRELGCAFTEIKPHLVIADFTIPVAGVVAYEQRAKWWTTLPSPCVFETPDGPPAYCGGLRPARTAAGRFHHSLLRLGVKGFKQMMFQIFRQSFVDAGIHSVYREDGTEKVYSPELILALGLEELEFPQIYPSHFHLIGPVLYTAPDEGPRPIFEPGRKHILVSIGTHLDYYKDQLAGEIRKLARQEKDLVFHFSDGRSGRARVERDDNFHRYSFVSYEEYVQRYAVIIHHGGAGIMYYCLKYGIPSIVLPLDYDQFDNAARLEYAGAAMRVKSPRQIHSALAHALQDSKMASKCRALSTRIACAHPEEAILRFLAAIDDRTNLTDGLTSDQSSKKE